MRCRFLLIAVLAFAPTFAAAEIVINMPGSTNNAGGALAMPQPQSVEKVPGNATNAPNGNTGVVPPLQGQPTGQVPLDQRPHIPMQACTQMWCQEGVTIVLPVDHTPGQYRFDVTADGKRTSCYGTLPLARCGDKSTVSCDGPGLTVQESGCALPPAQHAFYALHLATVPKMIEVTISSPGRAAINFAGPVNPRCFYPNGPQCDPRPCCQAQISAAPY